MGCLGYLCCLVVFVLGGVASGMALAQGGGEYNKVMPFMKCGFHTPFLERIAFGLWRYDGSLMFSSGRWNDPSYLMEM